MNPAPPRPTILLLLLGLAALYLAGLGMRRTVLSAQYEQFGEDLPFTLESALHFRRIEQVMESGALPEIDRDVFYPEGIRTRETYTVLSEYLQATVASWLPERVPLAHRVRWIESGWFCLGIPLMALWVGRGTRSVPGGAVAGLFYAVCLAAVIRSTGQELSRENFAMPFLLGHLAAAAWSLSADRPRRAWLWASISGGCLALAQVSWDLVQYYLVLWMLANAFRAVFSNRAWFEDGSVRVWTAGFAGLVLAAWLNPYLRAHGFGGGPILLLGWGIAIAAVASRIGMPRADRAGPALRLGLVLVPLAAMAWFGGGFGESYGHFGELLLAKLRFLNRKPLDPSLLTFDQRVMWVPALHSATIQLTARLFPAILWVIVIGVPVLLAQPRFRSDPMFIQCLGMAGVSLVATWFFVRFHVFAILFCCALAGVFVQDRLRRTGWRCWVPVGLVAVGIVIEAGQVLGNPLQWGRPGVYYAELKELTDWLNERVRPEPVLANFGTSASILATGGCPILLHPKFESEAIRDRFEAYTMELFHGTEASFREFADGEGAGYYVYGKGEFNDQVPVIYQMRYFADAVSPPDTVPARRFERGDPTLSYFRPVWENRKYRVYRIRTRGDEMAIQLLSASAERALQRGDLDAAGADASRVLEADPGNRRALKVLGHVERLREMNFSYEAE